MDNVASSVSPLIDHTIIDELFQLSPLPMNMIDDEVDEFMMMLAAAASPDPQIMTTFPVVDFSIPGEPAGGGLQEQQNPKILVDSKKRKSVHRDIERQRRHEMSLLYKSLRSRIPVELLKGKRSTCDHVHEAVRYIKHLENKILGLNNKKDELKKLSLPSDPTPIHTPPQILNRIDSTMKVKVNPSMAGLDITIDTDSKQGVSLSRVLRFLTHEGLSVVSYTSTRVNERLLHSIKFEVSEHDGMSVEVSDLQRRLMIELNYLALD